MADLCGYKHIMYPIRKEDHKSGTTLNTDRKQDQLFIKPWICLCLKSWLTSSSLRYKDCQLVAGKALVTQLLRNICSCSLISWFVLHSMTLPLSHQKWAAVTLPRPVQPKPVSHRRRTRHNAPNYDNSQARSSPAVHSAPVNKRFCPSALLYSHIELIFK